MIGSERVFACGVTESGKTNFLKKVFLPRSPRLLIIDQTGEWESEVDARDVSMDLETTLDNLHRVADRDTWKLVAYLDRDEISELIEGPLLRVPQIKTGFSYRVGGMGLYLDEVDVICPDGRSDVGARHAWRRGRHGHLSVYAATQRVGNVSKEVTSQCGYLAVLRQNDLNDVTYLRRELGRGMADHALRFVGREPYGVFLFDRHKRRGYFLDREYRQVRSSIGEPHQAELGDGDGDE